MIRKSGNRFSEQIMLKRETGVTFGAGTGVSTPAQPLQHVGGGKSVRRGPDRGLEAAQGLPRLTAELAVRDAAIEAALRQKLLQLQPLGPRQLPFLPRPRLHERRPAPQAGGKVPD